MSGVARITQPQRRFTPADLAELARSKVRKLVHALVEEAGGQIVEYKRAAAHDDLRVSVPLLWSNRSIRVRIGAREPRQADLDRLAEDVAVEGDAGGCFVQTRESAETFTVPGSVFLMSPAELIQRIERSSRVTWPDRSPTLAMERLQGLRELNQRARSLDPVGMRWLPILAHNELPPELTEAGGGPQDFFERLTFRLLTSVFRFGGHRYGEAARGQRLPDAVLRWPAAGRRTAALLDCKSSADGYVMEADHFLRFKHYFSALRDEIEADGVELRHMVVVSSEFPGTRGSRHPYHGRAKALQQETGLQLVYLRAIDLAQMAVSVEEMGLSPAQREALDWDTAFGSGLLSLGDLTGLLEAKKN